MRQARSVPRRKGRGDDMTMDFSSAIGEIMPLVRDGDKTKPFVITRDSVYGDWQVCYPAPDKADSFTESQREHDPYTAKYIGADFDVGSMPYVYNKILRDRLRSEYYEHSSDDWHSDADKARLRALINFFEDNVNSFSQMTTDYLASLDQPFRALEKMCPFNLATDWQDWTFNEDLAADALDYIENATEKLSCPKPEPVQVNKRVIEGYEEKHSIQVAGQLVILAENPKAGEQYMVCYCKWDNPLGINEYYNVCVIDDYTEALNLYAKGILSFTQILEKEMADYERPPRSLTAADCLPNSQGADLSGKIIVIKPEVLSPEYRRAERQLKICNDGFGALPKSRGSAVFCMDLYSGKESHFERYDVAGIIDPAKMPEWAVKKVALMEAIKEPGVFEYGGYHFKPYRKFEKRDGDFNKRINSASSDHALGIATYEWGKTEYSHAAFYAASGESEADIFRCVENGKLYIPAENELFRYNEPLLKEKAAQNPRKQPSLISPGC